MLKEKLTFRNGVDYLVQAAAFGANDFKDKVFAVLQHRGYDTTARARASAEGRAKVQQLQLEDMLVLVRLYNYLSADRLLEFVELWGADMEHGVFAGIFRSAYL